MTQLKNINFIVNKDSFIRVVDGIITMKNAAVEEYSFSAEDIIAVKLDGGGIWQAAWLSIATRDMDIPTGLLKLAFARNVVMTSYNKDEKAELKNIADMFNEYLKANPRDDGPLPDVIKDLSTNLAGKLTKEDLKDAQFVIHGSAKQALVACKDRLIILKPGFFAGATGGIRSTTFFYKSITGIEINSGWVTAVLEVSAPGYDSTKQHDFWAKDKDRDPFKLSNCLPLEGGKSAIAGINPRLEQIRRWIKSAHKPIDETANRSFADQLIQLKTLFDAGALTEEEFCQAKKKLIES